MVPIPDLRSLLLEAFKAVGVEWHIKGVVDGKGQLYTLSDDTKLISKVFELVAFPVITQALEPLVQSWETEDRQTVYPDLTLIIPGALPNKIAVDIKSTYRKGLFAGFTLGSSPTSSTRILRSLSTIPATFGIVQVHVAL